MSTTGFTATHAEFDDEERHIIAPPACSEHHLHHHHHREKRFAEHDHEHDHDAALSGEVGVDIGEEDLMREGVDSRAEEAHKEIVITAAQKMLSACSGSLLTSFLVTPLDVVRVRLQAQHGMTESVPETVTPASMSSSSTPLRAHKLPLSPLQFQSTFARLPPELGVTACCREVFWINSNAEFCIASSSPSSGFSAAASPASSFAEACQIEETSRRRFNGTWEGLVKIARYEGPTSLWRGLSPTLLMAIPANVIYFTGYDSLRTSPLSPFSDLNTTWAPLLAGSSARSIAATAISPLELFRTRLWATSTPKIQSGSGEIAAEIGAFRKTALGMVDMVRAEGWSSLWRGLTLTLWRDVPFSGIYWFGYESVKKTLQAQREKHLEKFRPFQHPSLHSSVKDQHEENTFRDSFIAGAVSGSVAAFFTTPFDVGKTRIQVAQHLAGETGAYKSMPKFLYGIFKEEGLRGLWRGCAPRMLKVSPACAIMISSYEVGKQWADKVNNKRRERGEWVG